MIPHTASRMSFDVAGKLLVNWFFASYFFLEWCEKISPNLRSLWRWGDSIIQILRTASWFFYSSLFLSCFCCLANCWWWYSQMYVLLVFVHSVLMLPVMFVSGIRDARCPFTRYQWVSIPPICPSCGLYVLNTSLVFTSSKSWFNAVETVSNFNEVWALGKTNINAANEAAENHHTIRFLSHNTRWGNIRVWATSNRFLTYIPFCSNMGAAGNAFPQELIDYIVDLLHDDLESLKSCSLASHLFVSSTRVHLFNSVCRPHSLGV